MLATLIIGGLEIPRYALTDDFSQSYEEIGGRATRRMLNGNALIQSNWTRLRTTLRGGGSLPAPLAMLDLGATYLIECAQHRHAAAAGNVVALPPGRRSGGGYDPIGYAVVDGLLVSTSIAIAGDEATLGTVTGAQHYEVRYWPRITAALVLSSSGEPWRAASGWEIVAEEA